MTTRYGGKLITSLSDKVLLIAETDVGNCLLRASETNDEAKYNAYFETLSIQAIAIAAEKAKRAL